MINHGTRGGYYAHRRLNKARADAGLPEEPICDDCRAAINEYVASYRAEHGLARNREREKIRRRALAALREAHRDEYEALVERFETEVAEEAGELI